MTQAKKTSFQSKYIAIPLMMALLGLGGCSGPDHSDLQRFVDDVKARPAGRVAPIPEFEVYESHTYNAQDQRDPFKPREEKELTEQRASDDGLRPDSSRNREALEAFPLDALQYVGMLERDNDRWAIVKAPDDLVYRVQSGNHLGQNYGQVESISESEIDITEIIPDGLGGWIKRKAALAISE